MGTENSTHPGDWPELFRVDENGLHVSDGDRELRLDAGEALQLLGFLQDREKQLLDASRAEWIADGFRLLATISAAGRRPKSADVQTYMWSDSQPPFVTATFADEADVLAIAEDAGEKAVVVPRSYGGPVLRAVISLALVVEAPHRQPPALAVVEDDEPQGVPA